MVSVPVRPANLPRVIYTIDTVSLAPAIDRVVDYGYVTRFGMSAIDKSKNFKPGGGGNDFQTRPVCSL